MSNTLETDLDPPATARAGSAAADRTDRIWPYVAAIGVLIALRFVPAAVLPLFFKDDEAYYWLWSRHLAWGYYDHPPAIAVLIRAGTALFGDTEFGVRVAGLLLTVPASLCVWRTASLLRGCPKDGAMAALVYNLTLMVTWQISTPDSPALACGAAFVWALMELAATRQPWWWLAAGLFAGLGLLSKYTMLFLGAGAALWLVLDEDMRPWLRTIWPWLGGGLAMVVFAPNLLWNAQHGWVTFVFQFGRIVQSQTSWRFFPEFWGGQLLLFSPFVVILAARGLWDATRSRDPKYRLLAAMLWPSILYFGAHSLHDRTRLNWISFLVPVVAVAAAVGFRSPATSRFVRAAALPCAALILAGALTEVLFRVVPLGAHMTALNPRLVSDMRSLGSAVSRDLRSAGARAIATADYPATAWARFYLPPDIPVIQLNEEDRYPDRPRATASDLAGTLMFLSLKSDPSDLLAASFTAIDPLDTGPPAAAPPNPFLLFRLGGFHGEPFGRIF